MPRALTTIRHGDTVNVELDKAFTIVNAAQGLVLNATVTNAGVHYFIPHSSDATTDDSEKVTYNIPITFRGKPEEQARTVTFQILDDKKKPRKNRNLKLLPKQKRPLKPQHRNEHIPPKNVLAPSSTSENDIQMEIENDSSWFDNLLDLNIAEDQTNKPLDAQNLQEIDNIICASNRDIEVTSEDNSEMVLNNIMIDQVPKTMFKEYTGTEFKSKSHVRVHSAENEFQCQFCNTAFKESGNLKDHVDLVHKAAEPDMLSQIFEELFSDGPSTSEIDLQQMPAAVLPSSDGQSLPPDFCTAEEAVADYFTDVHNIMDFSHLMTL